MSYHGDRWVTDDFCCHRHRRGDAYIKKRCFCAVSALFLNRLSPSRKNKLLIASMLPTDGDSDRCFATFFYSTFAKFNLVRGVSKSSYTSKLNLKVEQNILFSSVMIAVFGK